MSFVNIVCQGNVFEVFLAQILFFINYSDTDIGLHTIRVKFEDSLEASSGHFVFSQVVKTVCHTYASFYWQTFVDLETFFE